MTPARTSYTEWMVGELSDEIAGTSVLGRLDQAAVRVTNGLTECETKGSLARRPGPRRRPAASSAATRSGAVFVRDQLDILESAGVSPDRYIWIHTQAEPDVDLHLEVARRGSWIEYDAIGSDDLDDAFFVERIKRVLDADLGGRLPSSQDRGTYRITDQPRRRHAPGRTPI